MPAGVEKNIQVEDWELFDFDLEVEPVLEVLIGRSLVHSRCELIEEYEKNEYVKHRTQYEQRREFELINLQRMEAARERREEEKDRRKKQVIQRDAYSKVCHKKLIAHSFARSYLHGLKSRAIGHLKANGILKDELYLKTTNYIYDDLMELTGKRKCEISEIMIINSQTLLGIYKKDKLISHASSVSKDHHRVATLKSAKEQQIIVY